VPFFFVYSPTYFLADGKGNNYIFIPNYFFTSFLGVPAAFYGESRRRALRSQMPQHSAKQLITKTMS